MGAGSSGRRCVFCGARDCGGAARSCGGAIESLGVSEAAEKGEGEAPGISASCADSLEVLSGALSGGGGVSISNCVGEMVGGAGVSMVLLGIPG